MIKQLRRKLVTTSMIATNVVLIVAIIIIFFTGFSRISESMQVNMERALDYPVNEGNQMDFARDFTDVVLVVYDKQTNNVDKLFVGERVDKDFVEKIFADIHYIVDKGENVNNTSIKLQYKIGEDAQGKVKIVFFDPANFQSGYIPLVLYASIVLVVGVLSYSLISMMLTQSAIAPIEESWKKQRQFVADASHELKTPLSVIMANMEIISSHPDDTVASQQKWIDNTLVEAKRMATLVQDLLFLAKSDDGMKVEMVEMSLTDSVQSCVLTHEAIFYENRKFFTSDIADDVVILGNDGQIKQLVTILLDNANKYSLDDGNINLTLTSVSKHALLQVSNDSAEVSPEQVAHLFDRFYTVDASRNKNNGGNGLGLSIAERIVQTHKGTITAEYKNGKMTFKATFPLLRKKGSKTQ